MAATVNTNMEMVVIATHCNITGISKTLMNQACPLMTGFYSDLIYDIQRITNMADGDKLFIVVGGMGTHTHIGLNELAHLISDESRVLRVAKNNGEYRLHMITKY